jgi:hypothetical protein
MAGSNTRIYWFVGVPLLAILASLFIPVNKPSTPYQIRVYIHCHVDSTQEEVQVHIGDTVAWPSATTFNYSANFSADHTPFHVGDYTGAPVPTVGSAPAKVTGDKDCHAPKSPVDAKCYFDYSVYVDGTNKCNDPGIRVVPSNQITLLELFLVKFKALLASLFGSRA